MIIFPSVFERYPHYALAYSEYGAIDATFSGVTPIIFLQYIDQNIAFMFSLFSKSNLPVLVLSTFLLFARKMMEEVLRCVPWIILNY